MIKALCKPCAAGLEAVGKTVKKVESRSSKITCAECGRRRFGNKYDVTGRARKSGAERSKA